ncbi:MAG: aldolase/citrate lyase family protein [Pigmentiphaga sp.]|uniref:HpcH/HpaI aldolase family protein n=1 Tax=Pigmentiphaga sp. TaxID=1977564 RepID=UPI0029A3D599|nr:aldolase/citrate lyase family protein [Pigmentiphaga sp.]MDX3904187.1 aldolase/citrate lyase family protein [Pigmentiphaga sp.]
MSRVLREALAAKKTVFGGWCALPCAFGAELMADAGLDYVCVDQQHGLIDYAHAVPMFTAIERAGAIPVTRVPAAADWMIAKALDAGAQAVIVPMCETAEQAAAVVSACRYPPEGTRSYGPIRAALVRKARDTAVLGGEPMCLVMIESRKGLENLDAIVATPGLDGIYIGPADLALGLGLEPDLDKPEKEHADAIVAILRACQRQGLVAGIQCSGGASGRKYAGMGFGFITIAKDSALLQAGTKQELARAVGETANPAAAGYT